MMRLSVLGLMFVSAFFVNLPQEPARQSQSGKRLAKISEYIAQAGKLYKDGKFQFSANKINAAQKLLVRSIKEGKQDFRDGLQKEHGRISKAHELLSAEGIEMSALDAFPEDYGVMQDAESVVESEGSSSAGDGGGVASNAVSFTASIAPILSAKCGNCHMSRSLGDYSMASFDSMMAGSPGGDSVVAGKPDDSLLYSLIESGEMPKRDTFDDKDLQLIKQWIEEGAEFDGKDKKASFAGNQGRRRGR